MDNTKNSDLKKVKVIGEIEIFTPANEPTGTFLEVGSVQEVPAELASAWLEKGLAEAVEDDAPANGGVYEPTAEEKAAAQASSEENKPQSGENGVKQDEQSTGGATKEEHKPAEKPDTTMRKYKVIQDVKYIDKKTQLKVKLRVGQEVEAAAYIGEDWMSKGWVVPFVESNGRNTTGASVY